MSELEIAGRIAIYYKIKDYFADKQCSHMKDVSEIVHSIDGCIIKSIGVPCGRPIEWNYIIYGIERANLSYEELQAFYENLDQMQFYCCEHAPKSWAKLRNMNWIPELMRRFSQHPTVCRFRAETEINQGDIVFTGNNNGVTNDYYIAQNLSQIAIGVALNSANIGDWIVVRPTGSGFGSIVNNERNEPVPTWRQDSAYFVLALRSHNEEALHWLKGHLRIYFNEFEFQNIFNYYLDCDNVSGDTLMIYITKGSHQNYVATFLNMEFQGLRPTNRTPPRYNEVTLV